jgi:hypothetical protein
VGSLERRQDCKESGTLTKPLFFRPSMRLHVAVCVGFDGGAGLVDGVIEEVLPNLLMDEVPVGVFASRASWDNGGVGAFGIFFDIEVGDEAT